MHRHTKREFYLGEDLLEYLTLFNFRKTKKKHESFVDSLERSIRKTTRNVGVLYYGDKAAQRDTFETFTIKNRSVITAPQYCY